MRVYNENWTLIDKLHIICIFYILQNSGSLHLTLKKDMLPVFNCKEIVCI